MKPGYLTTEFYLTILVSLNAIGALFGVTVDEPLLQAVAVVAAAVATAAYSYSRGKAKAA